MLRDKHEPIGKDGDLPGLAALFDEDLLTARIRALPPFAGLRSLKIDYIRYKPATSCVATLILQFADGERRWLAAKALTLTRFEVSWRHPRRQKLINNGDPFAPLAIPELGIILSYPQHDRALPGLALLNGSRERDAQLRSWLPDIAVGARLELNILRYKPERRLLALLRCNGRPWATLRFASDERYQAMLTGNRLGHATGEIELLAALPEQRLLIARWIDGETLCAEQAGNLTEQDVFLLGGKLARLHSLKISLPDAPLPDGIRDAWQVLNTLKVVAPIQQEKFISLLTGLAKKLTGRLFRRVVIHGDFTVDQVVKRTVESQLRLIDWDRATAGHPAVDLAAFQARLELQVIEKTLTPNQARRIVAALHEGYRQQRGHLPPLLADYTALALLQLAAEPFRKRTAGWPQHIDELLQRAGELMAQREPPADPAATLSGLLSKPRIAPLLRQALGLPAAAMLEEATLVTHKPGRRAVLAWRWTSAPDELSIIGKYRYKGFEPHGFLVQQALWRNGFSGDSDIIVPEPLAVLEAQNLWLQQHIAGERVTKALSPDNKQLAATGELVGTALARLQHSRAAQRAVAGKRWSVKDELETLRQRLKQAATTRPAWAARIADVSRACEQLALALSPTPGLFLHRDFYPAQLLLTDARPRQLAVLDFDLAALGPPSLDAGNYIAHLREQALRDYGDDKALAVHEDAFLAAWLARSAAADIANISIFTTLALARHIAISLLFPERHHTTASLLALCEARLKHAAARRGC